MSLPSFSPFSFFGTFLVVHVYFLFVKCLALEYVIPRYNPCCSISTPFSFSGGETMLEQT